MGLGPIHELALGGEARRGVARRSFFLPNVCDRDVCAPDDLGDQSSLQAVCAAVVESDLVAVMRHLESCGMVWWIVAGIVASLMVLAVWLKSRPKKFERKKSFDEATLLAQFERQLQSDHSPFPPIEWLIRRIDVDEFEKDIDKWDGRWRDYSWRPFKARMTDRDELWEFDSPAKYWEGLAGREGVALVRDGRPIAHVVTLMN